VHRRSSAVPLPLHCKGATSCFFSRHSWLRPKTAPSPSASSAVSNPENLRVNPCVQRGSRRAYISRRNVDSYETHGRCKASIYGRALAGCGGGQTVIDNEFHQSHEWNGNSIVSLRESFKFEVSSVKQERPGPTIVDCGFRIADWKTQAGGGHRRLNAQNEPNFAPAGMADGGIAQNKAKLGMTGVCGKRLSSRGPSPGRGVKRAKRTQFGPGRARAPEVKRAKQTQFVKGTNERKHGSLKRL
jgi:hypothetical protein